MGDNKAGNSRAIGITSYGAYIPFYRMSREILTSVWGNPAGKGEKAIASYDEDTITMAVEACVDALGQKDRNVDALYFASTSPAYREKQCASIVAAALDFSTDREFFTTDFTNSMRAGTDALKMAADVLRGGGADQIIVAMADCRLPAPNTLEESLYGDGAAAFVLGRDNVAVEIEESYSYFSEFMDTWRKDRDRYPLTWEDRFIFEEGYAKHFPKLINGLLEKCNLTKDDFQKFVLYAPDAKSFAKMGKILKLDPKKVQQPLFDSVGHTGCALAPMMLVEALQDAEPGDRILFANYGDGGDAFSLKVTDQIKNLKGIRGVKGYLKSKYALANYGKYLTFRDLMEWENERRPKDASSATMNWRESNQFLRFHGGKCRNCGTIQHPIQRVCAVCQTKDDYEEVRLSDKRGILFSFSMDERAMVKELPNVVCIVDFHDGGRYAGVMSDRIPQDLTVGIEIEMTLRNLHDGSGIHNYCWKARPVRISE